MIHSRIIAALVLLIVALLVIRGMTKRHRTTASQLNYDDLLIDQATGRISKAAAVLWGSFLVSSWVVVTSRLDGTLTDAMFGAYLLTYAAPAVVKIIGDMKATPVATTETLTTVKTSTPAGGPT